MKNIRSFFGVIIMMCIVALPLASCSDDDDDTPSVDKTALNQLISECETLANNATTDNYPQAAITAFKTVISTVKTAAASSSITQTQVDNLIQQLTTARDIFLATAYETIPVSALLIGLNFDTEGDQLTTTGQRTLTASLVAGPTEIFGATAAKPTFVTGVKSGKAMHFGFGGHLEIADYNQNDFMLNTMSIAVWVKPDSVRANNYIASLNFWENWKFQLQDQSKPFFTLHTAAGFTDADNESDNSAPNGEWTHLIITMDLAASKLSFYVNGELTKAWDATGKANLIAPLAPFYVPTGGTKLPFLISAANTYAAAVAAGDWDWAFNPPSWPHFVGSMDNFRLYSIALTEGQVSGLYNAEKP